MRQFLRHEMLRDLLTPRTVNSVSAIHEARGRISGLSEAEQNARGDILESLRDIALIQSTESSNRIEGIRTSDFRLKELVAEKTMPHNRDEQEIVGYRDVLSLIHEQHEFIPVTANVLLQLHRDLFAQTGLQFGGHWKDSDNAIVEISADGSRRVRFQPTPAIETPEAVGNLCDAYREVAAHSKFDPLIIAPVFVFDFVSIHPFNDGNGRMSRLLLLLLLYKAGYSVGRYISIEKAIENSKQTYYETLKACSANWHQGENAYGPFVEYILGTILSAHRELEDRLLIALDHPTNKAQRIKETIARHIGAFSKSDLQSELPDISQITIERTLKAMLEQGLLQKIGAGRGTRYVKAN